VFYGIKISLLLVEMSNDTISLNGGNVVIRPDYALDITGKSVKIDWESVEVVENRGEEMIRFVATIKDIIPKQSIYKLSPNFETLFQQKNVVIPKVNRSTSPCPCGSVECIEDYKLWKE
jgi:hypothetical protein